MRGLRHTSPARGARSPSSRSPPAGPFSRSSCSWLAQPRLITGVTGKPCSASSIAGPSASASVIRPKRLSVSDQPAIVPGAVTACAPCRSKPSAPPARSSVSAAGLRPLPLIASTAPSEAR